MTDEIEITWGYKPSDFFEEPYTHLWNKHEIFVNDGKARIQIPGMLYDSNNDIVNDIFNCIEGLFLGAQLVNNKPFELDNSNRTMTRRRPDGGRDIYLKASSGAMSMTGSVDMIVRDSDGNIISDSKADRAQVTSEYAELAASNWKKDQTAESIFGSFRISVEDRENELVHLYEITESLRKRYCNEKAVITALDGVSRRKWRRLRGLANSNLNQGRHRGQYPGQLRDATPEELEEARAIARSMIEAYLKNLE